MKHLFPTGAISLLLSLTLLAQAPVAPRAKISASLLERSGKSPNQQVVVHVLLNRAVLYQASAETQPNLARRRAARAGDLLGDAAAARQEFATRAAQLLGPDADAITAVVTEVQGKLLARALSSGDVVVVVPASGLERLAALPGVSEIVEDIPLQGGLDVSVPSIGASAFWNAGEDGSNVKVGIIDSGVDLTNPAFNGVSAQSSAYLAAAQAQDPNCFVDSTSTDDIQGHGTHVAGIVFSRGASQCTACKGVANGATLWNLKAGYKSSCSGTPSIRWADAQSALSGSTAVQVYNMSYGTPFTCDANGTKYACDDDAVSRAWDTTVDTTNQAATICAGNDGGAGGANTLWAPAIAYNIVSVANVDDRGTVSRSDDAINAGSSYGPTFGGRKKPDISAPGTSINSANANWEAGSQFISETGTSMAAPHVAGAMALLLNAAAAENIPALLDPRSLKAVLINSAELRGVTTWEAHWGWGYLDAANAYQHRKAVFLDAVTAGGARLYAGSTLGNAGKATLAWNRHPLNSYVCPTGTLPLNNLDLFAYDEADGSTLAVSASTVDNVEQVIAKDKSTAVLRVVSVCTGFTGGEQYALATENGFVAAAPALRLRIPPQNMVPGGQGTVSVEAYNDGNIAMHGVKVTLSLPAGMRFETGLPTVTIARLAANSSTVLSWQVATPVKEGLYGATASAASTSYGIDFSASAAQSFTVGNVANFVITLARPVRGLRAATTPIIVAGQARGFDIVANGITSSETAITRCNTPEGVECEIRAEDSPSASRRRFHVRIRPSVTTDAARYTADVSVETIGGGGAIELPFQVRPARTAHVN